MAKKQIHLLQGDRTTAAGIPKRLPEEEDWAETNTREIMPTVKMALLQEMDPTTSTATGAHRLAQMAYMAKVAAVQKQRHTLPELV